MYTLDDLKLMTIAQLRKFGKTQGVEVPTGMLKGDIIANIWEKISSSFDVKQEADKIARRVMPVEDDDFEEEDEPVLTVKDHDDLKQGQIKFNSPEVGIITDDDDDYAVQPKQAVSSVPKPNKPQFSLAGAKAWHNPSPYQSKQPQPAIPSVFGNQGASETKPIFRSNRFGPDLDSENEETLPLPPQPMSKENSILSAKSSIKAPKFTTSYKPENITSEVFLSSLETSEGSGVLEILPEGHGLLSPRGSNNDKDLIYVSATQIRRFALRSGDFIEGKIRAPRESDKYSALLYISAINGENIENRGKRPSFDFLTAECPKERFYLSKGENQDMLLRMLDLFNPIGHGSRLMLEFDDDNSIFSAIQKIAKSLNENNENLHIICLLSDIKPEEVEKLKQEYYFDFVTSSFYDSYEKQVRNIEFVQERAMRLAESGQNVVIISDNILKHVVAFDGFSFDRKIDDEPSEASLRKALKLIGFASSYKEGGSITSIVGICSNDLKIKNYLKKNISNVACFGKSRDKLLLNFKRSSFEGLEPLRNKDEAYVYNRIMRMLDESEEKDVQLSVCSMLEKTADNSDLFAKFEGWMRLLETK